METRPFARMTGEQAMNVFGLATPLWHFELLFRKHKSAAPSRMLMRALRRLGKC